MLMVTVITIATNLLGQTTEVLQLGEKKYYSEKDSLSRDSLLNLVQEICYDEPEVIDEEHCFYLKLSILDTTKARQLRLLNVSRDTSIINCLFYIRSVWSPMWNILGDRKATITGTVKIVSWTTNSITADLHLRIKDYRRSKTYLYIYKGQRIFIASKN
jgi:hypothetical protein